MTMKAPTVGLLMAMTDEAQPLIDALELTPVPLGDERLPFRRYRGTLGNLNIVLQTAGEDPYTGVDNIGTDAAVLSTYSLLRDCPVTTLLNPGTAGGFAQRGATIGTVYLSHKEFVFHDRRVPLPGFEHFAEGHIPAADTTALARATGLARGIISTGASLARQEADLAAMTRIGAVAKEMEAAAIAWTAQWLRVPVVAIKSITNLLDEPGASEEQFARNLARASDALRLATQKVLEALDQGVTVD
jgi:adenosylhomocysteine nucleosidase/5'-methylthioadenosine nucleosidase